jgi:hypothetical protein
MSPLLPTWHESLEPALAARLTRPLLQPGSISMHVVQRILGWLEYLERRRALSADVLRRRSPTGALQTEQVPIVHAQWMGAAAPTAAAPGAQAASAAPSAPVRAVSPSSAGPRPAPTEGRAGSSPDRTKLSPPSPLPLGDRRGDGGVHGPPSPEAGTMASERSAERVVLAPREPEAGLRRVLATPLPALPFEPVRLTEALPPLERKVVSAVRLPPPQAMWEAREVALRGTSASAAHAPPLPERMRVRPIPFRAAREAAPAELRHASAVVAAGASRVDASEDRRNGARPVVMPSPDAPGVSEHTRPLTSAAADAGLPRVQARAPGVLAPATPLVDAAADMGLPRVQARAPEAFIPLTGAVADMGLPRVQARAPGAEGTRAALTHAAPSYGGVSVLAAREGVGLPSPVTSAVSLRGPVHEAAAPAQARSTNTTARGAVRTPPPPAAVTASAQELDIDSLVDKVQRSLLRQLAVERERKGDRR